MKKILNIIVFVLTVLTSCTNSEGTSKSVNSVDTLRVFTTEKIEIYGSDCALLSIKTPSGVMYVARLKNPITQKLLDFEPTQDFFLEIILSDNRLHHFSTPGSIPRPKVEFFTIHPIGNRARN